MPTDVVKSRERKLGSAMMRWSAAGAMVPDPIPLVDEILFGIVFTAGAGIWAHGAFSAETSAKVPLKMTSSPPITSTTRTLSRGGKRRTHVRQKQMSSTSHYYSRRKQYDPIRKKRNRY